jgi:hypothetical protein
VIEVNPGNQARSANVVQLEILDLLVQLVFRERRVHLGKEVFLAWMVRLVFLVQQGQRDRLEMPAKRDPREILGDLEHRVFKAFGVQQVCQAAMDVKDV